MAPTLLRSVRAVSLSALAALLLVPQMSHAQQRAGAVFNQVFNVGGAGTRGGADNGSGSVGCGGGGGGDLSNSLNAVLGGSGFDSQQPLALRRDLWRFCDNMTTNMMMGPGAGAWTGQIIAPAQENAQNSGFAPAELFNQTEIAEALGRFHTQNVMLRVQTLRLAMRDDAVSPEVQIARHKNRPARTLAEQFAFEGGRFADIEAGRERANRQLLADLQNMSFASTEVFGVEGLGYFANGRYHRITSDTTIDQRGTTTNGGGITIGSDYRPNDSLFVGGAFGYSHFATDFAFGTGKSSANDYALMGFGNWYVNEQFYVDGLFRWSWMAIDQEKRVTTLDPGPAFAPRRSNPSAWTLSADFGAGMDWSREALRLNPYVRLRVTHNRVNAFTETGGDGSLNLSLREQSVTSVPLTLGATASYNVSTAVGVVTPYVRAQYIHEFGDQTPFIEGVLAAIPTAVFRLPPNAVVRNYGQVGVGGTMAFAQGWSGFADYDALVGYTALQTHTVTVGVRRDL